MRASAKRTTGIGSLPHHNVDAALEHSFRMGIPFLPQIPIRNSWEYLLAQALEGIPGLQAQSDGTCTLASDVWASRARELDCRLDEAFAKNAADPAAFSFFEPGTSVSSSWQPFVWELHERTDAAHGKQRPPVKVQIAGPLTARWALCAAMPGLDQQIYRLILARSLAMCRRLKTAGAEPILFLDEPGLYSFSKTDPRHSLALRELKLLIQAIRKEGYPVGVHVCSNADWGALLDLGMDILSIDTHLSLGGLLSPDTRQRAERFLLEGGRLALGVIPTDKGTPLHSLSANDLLLELLGALKQSWNDKPEVIERLLSSALYTPACGLALHTPEDAEAVLGLLDEFYDRLLKT